MARTKKTTAPKMNKHKHKLTETLKKLRDLKKSFGKKIKEAKTSAHQTGYQKGVAEALKAAEKVNKALFGKLQKKGKKTKATKSKSKSRKKEKHSTAGSMAMGGSSSKRRGRPKKPML